MDISGLHPVLARGERYNLVLLDEATRWRWSYAMKAKGDVPGHIRNWMRQVENLTSQTVKRWHSNNGGKFMSKVMEGIAKEHGIIHEPTAPYNPE